MTVSDEMDEVADEDAPVVKVALARIHIEFPGRAFVSVESGIDPSLARAVLEGLKR